MNDFGIETPSMHLTMLAERGGLPRSTQRSFLDEVVIPDSHHSYSLDYKMNSRKYTAFKDNS